ncbi:hypothetical protein Pcinc_026845 [Petrolisthes cinctipes]|uniref:Programmed cell death protein 2 C-terminal domain-containing protein n=1 Tax=Petrolisthes cinctipes TaxID=88211 RepID=A0AAE1KBP7_PETCI|nr:hypothetical protein Pcinc_026845 [Petrolisthes cinctipes]
MAWKPSLVLLGYIDEQISSKNQQSVGFTVSKVGGIPDWCVAGCEVPSCKRCGRKQSLVVQVYAPLDGGVHHRTLYLFTCVTQECWNRSHSWTCLRSQILDPSATKTTSRPPPSSSVSPYSSSGGGGSGGSGWFEENDDWGGGGNDNDGNGNTAPTNPYQHHRQHLSNTLLSSAPTTTTSTTPPQQQQHSLLDNAANRTGGTNLNNMNNPNTTSTTTTTTTTNVPPNTTPPTIAHVTHSMDTKLSIIEDDANANEAVCGAVGMVGGCEGEGVEASAVIEGPEGDMIAVDTPEQPTTDIPALFQAAAEIDANADVTFVPFFLVSEVEPNEDTAFSEHERELLLSYTHTTGHDLRQEDMAVGGDGQGDGVYEKDIAIHGDVLLHKFKKRISRSPQQVLRYSREEGASPLWLRGVGSGEGGGRCQHCGGPLTFEMQLTPQLLLHLRVTGSPGSAMEFGTVVVFTCAASCWADTDTTRAETLVVQAEVI